MADIVKFNGHSILPTSPEEILNLAKEWELTSCIVLGNDSDGEFIIGGSTCEAGDILMMLELAKKFIIENHFVRKC